MLYKKNILVELLFFSEVLYNIAIFEDSKSVNSIY